MLRIPPVLKCGLPLAALAMFACSTGAPPPSWLEERPAPYSDERWVVGVGSGATAEEAGRVAFEKIGEQTGGVTTDAKIADTWAKEEGSHWALAVLDRVPLRAQTEAELARVEQEIGSARARVAELPPEQGLPEMIDALALLPERDALRSRLTLLGGAPSEGDELPAELAAELAAIKQNLPIEINALSMDPETGEPGEPVDEVRRALAQRVTQLGFPVRTRGWGWQEDSSWILVEMRLGLDPLDLPDKDRLVAVHWDAALEINDATGRVIAVLTEEGRVTHSSEREARRRAREDAEAFAVTALESWLSGRILPEATASLP